MKFILFIATATLLLSNSLMADSAYETYRVSYQADIVVINLKGLEAQILYRQLVGPEVEQFTFPNFSERLGKDIKCMKSDGTYRCEIEINANGKAQMPANG